MRPERKVVDVGSPEWLACCAYHVSLANGGSETEAGGVHDEALEEAMRAKSDWMQVFENDKAKAAAALKYPATKYESPPYYAGVEVPATYEKEYHASIIRVGQLEAEVKALRAEVTRQAEFWLMLKEQGAQIKARAWRKVILPGSDPETIAAAVRLLGQKLARIEEGAGVEGEKRADTRPTLSDHVEKVLEGLSQGMTTTSQEERLTRGLQDRKLGRISRRW